MILSVHKQRGAAGIAAALCGFALGLAAVSYALGAEQKPAATKIKAFQPGESLSYDISWSKMLKAGTADMEVKSELLPDGREVFRIVVISHTVGAVGRLYKLGDTVQSVFDPRIMQSLSFSLRESRGNKTRRRDLIFDHERRTVTIRLNDDPPEAVAIPERVQDSLSSLYYLRTREDFIMGRPITFDAFDSDKSWAIEVETLGRERVRTPAGEFSTIKVRAYRGLFMSEGEVLVWLSDDVRKIPVIIKSKIAIGSLVFTLTSLRTGENP